MTPDQAPVAALTAKPAAAGQATTFDASATTAKFGQVASYAWDFGDGAKATTTGPATSHTYAKEGVYEVKVTATTSNGTSTTVVFTGQTASRNGGPAATATLRIAVGITCGGQVPTIVGTDGDDTITGTTGDDVVLALGGNDKVDGGDGDDRICGGDGNDTLSGNADDDRLYGGAGDDAVKAGTGDDRIQGNEGRDALSGRQGNDYVNGGKDDDELLGGSGADRVLGKIGERRREGRQGRRPRRGRPGRRPDLHRRR